MLEYNWGVPLRLTRSRIYKANAKSKYHFFGTNRKSLCNRYDLKSNKASFFGGDKSDFSNLMENDGLCSVCLKLYKQMHNNLKVDSRLTESRDSKPIKETTRLDSMLGQVVQHHSGRSYKVLTVVNHTETNEKLVIYKGMYIGSIEKATPVDIFLREVDTNKYPNATQKYEYELITT